MSARPYSPPMSPAEPPEPALFYVGRQNPPGKVAATMRAGLDPLRELPAILGRSFRGSVSTRHGLHLAITSGTFSPVFRDGVDGETTLEPGLLVELVEYDPVRHTLMAVGKGEPARASPLHWFVYRCFPDRGACLHLEGGEGSRPPASVPIVPLKPAVFNSDVCLRIAEHLREHPCVGLADGSAVATGVDMTSASRGLVEMFRSGRDLSTV